MEENFNEENDINEEERYEYPSEVLEHSSENSENEILNEDDYIQEKR